MSERETMKNTVILFLALSLCACGSRHVDDRVKASEAAVLPAGYGEGPYHAVIATRDAPQARVIGNYVLITEGREPVYVMPTAFRHLEDASLDAYQESLHRVNQQLEDINQALVEIQTEQQRTEDQQ